MPARDSKPTSLAGQRVWSDKENRRPRGKAKKGVSIAGLFRNTRSRRRGFGGGQHGQTPWKAGNGRSVRPQPATTGMAAEAAPDSPSLSISGAAMMYRRTAVAACRSQLQPTLTALSARVDGLEAGESALYGLGLPSIAEVIMLGQDRQAICSALDDEILTYKKTSPTGSSTLVDARIGDALPAFGQKVESRRVELERLFKDLQHVQAEIDTVRQSIIDTETTSGNREMDDLEADLAGVRKDADSTKAQTLREVALAREADQEHKAETTRRFKEFVGTLS